MTPFPENLYPSSPFFNDPSSPDQIDPQNVLNFIRLYQFYKYCTELIYTGSSRNGIVGNKMVVFPEHEPADKLFIDFTGKKIQLVDPRTGEVTDVEVFVAVLGGRS